MKIVESLDKEKYPIPDTFPYQEVRELFRNPEITDPESVDVSASSRKRQLNPRVFLCLYELI